jgi:hypothetical protein
MRLFFGKFSASNDKFEKQLNDKVYYSKRESGWFNGMQEGDYCFILAGKDVYLWKAKEYHDSNLQFESVIDDKLPMTSNDFKAFKYFMFNPQNVVLSTRQVRNKGYRLFSLLHSS